MPADTTVEIIKAIENPNSKQAQENKTTVGTRSPNIPFSVLTDLYYDSFVVGWLTDKIATAINSWFDTKDKSLLDAIMKIDHEFLNRNKVLSGNAFFEVIEDGKWKVVELIPIISSTIEIMEDWDGYRQQVGTDTVYFNAFTPKDKRPERTAIYTASGAKADELINTGKGCGFNPALNQVYHFKNTSLSTKYYWASYYEAVVDQLLLIEQIDKYYSKAFDNGMIRTKLIYPTNEKKTFSKDDKTILKEFIRSKMKGVDNAFSTAIVDQQVGQLDLEHDIDANAFIDYRKELLKSVSIALNVPYDLLLSDNSNRASSQTSKETFNDYTIYPQQVQNLTDFKILFAEWYKVDDLEYKWIDTDDQKEEMEVLTWYKKAGIMTANEVREKIWLAPIDWGNELIVDTKASQRDAVQDLIKSEAQSFYKNLTDLENDLYGNIQHDDKKVNTKTV